MITFAQLALICATLSSVTLRTVHAECTLPKITEVDYPKLKDACSDTSSLCDACLKEFISQIIEKTPDDALKEGASAFTDADGEFNDAAIRDCATPYAPEIISNQVFPSVMDALKLLDCPSEDAQAAFAAPLAAKGLSDLLPGSDTADGSDTAPPPPPDVATNSTTADVATNSTTADVATNSTMAATNSTMATNATMATNETMATNATTTNSTEASDP